MPEYPSARRCARNTFLTWRRSIDSRAVHRYVLRPFIPLFISSLQVTSIPEYHNSPFLFFFFPSQSILGVLCLHFYPSWIFREGTVRNLPSEEFQVVCYHTAIVNFVITKAFTLRCTRRSPAGEGLGGFLPFASSYCGLHRR